MKNLILLAALSALPPRPAAAFCGFFVAKADAQLFNKASQVVLVRDGDRTAITMGNDYRGEPKEFAIVVPVPVVLKREQINVGDQALVARLDAFTSPRLVEYHDEDPCSVQKLSLMAARGMAQSAARGEGGGRARAKALGVTIEASYTVGEYDILILGAKDSMGLETWLREQGYKLPRGASAALGPYLKQKLKFFVAKVNLAEHAKTGSSTLRPIQFAYEDPRFMLPIRLGMLNADGPQDLMVYALTKNGRVETVNYRTVKMPTGTDIPLHVRDQFGDFYRATFARLWEKEGRKAVVTEHFWDMGWCDPCAADPLSAEELRKLGVWWLADDQGGGRPARGRRFMVGGAVPVKVTRLHVRYDAEHFPEDLVFQETADTQNYQGRFVMHTPWTGAASCDAAKAYPKARREREELWAKNLAELTGWELAGIRSKMSLDGPLPTAPQWYEKIFR
ncbi:MAG: DUF2330 domain-containing protein [Elusimicrobia bacterium]|nr:DUF2330 domain-containing protein [Elusimicrobiota bacterium]